MTAPTATSFVHLSPCDDGEGWRGRPLISTFAEGESLMFLGAHGGQVADPLIEARNLVKRHSIFFTNQLQFVYQYNCRSPHRRHLSRLSLGQLYKPFWDIHPKTLGAFSGLELVLFSYKE